MSTNQHPTPTCAELCARATQGPWIIHPAKPMDDSISDIKSGEQAVCSTCPDDCNYREWEEGEEEANAQLIARMSPENVMEIYQAVAWANQELFLTGTVPVNEGMPVSPLTRALNLLDGIAPERK